MGLPGTGNSMCKGTEVREQLLGLGYARTALGLDQKGQAGRGQHRGWKRDGPGYLGQGLRAQEVRALLGRQKGACQDF